MIKAVFFDIDGTLVDSVDLHALAWQEAFRHFGMEFELSAIRQEIGKGGDQLIPVFMSAEDVKRRGKDIQDFRAKLFADTYMDQVKPFRAVRALFERIRNDERKIIVVSSGKASEVERYLEIASVTDLVDDSVSSDDVERSKPHGDLFAVALAKAGVGADEALVVGDTPFDAEAAAKVGLKTIGLLSGGFARERLKEAGCIAIYRDPQSLLRNYNTSPIAVDRMPTGESTYEELEELLDEAIEESFPASDPPAITQPGREKSTV